MGYFHLRQKHNKREHSDFLSPTVKTLLIQPPLSKDIVEKKKKALTKSICWAILNNEQISEEKTCLWIIHEQKGGWHWSKKLFSVNSSFNSGFNTHYQLDKIEPNPLAVI